MILDLKTARTVKAALAKQGMTHKALAAHLKVSRLTLWRVLRGKRRVTAKERRLMAAALGVEPAAIFPRRSARWGRSNRAR